MLHQFPHFLPNERTPGLGPLRPSSLIVLLSLGLLTADHVPDPCHPGACTVIATVGPRRTRARGGAKVLPRNASP